MSVLVNGERHGQGTRGAADPPRKQTGRKAVRGGRLRGHTARPGGIGVLRACQGSFTGALADKTGAFEAANGGTLFLDEVGNLTYETQVQLLRALQERRIRPVGSNREIPCRYPSRGSDQRGP